MDFMERENMFTPKVIKKTKVQKKQHFFSAVSIVDYLKLLL